MQNTIIRYTCAVIVSLCVLASVNSYAQTLKTCNAATPCSIFWTGNTEPDIDTYRLYIHKVGVPFPTPRIPLMTIKHPQTALNNTVFMGLLSAQTAGDYGLVLTAVDKTGNESGNSNELLVRFSVVDVIPPAIPNLQLFQAVIP